LHGQKQGGPYIATQGILGKREATPTDIVVWLELFLISYMFIFDFYEFRSGR
jgi:hypothetical protein